MNLRCGVRGPLSFDDARVLPHAALLDAGRTDEARQVAASDPRAARLAARRAGRPVTAWNTARDYGTPHRKTARVPSHSPACALRCAPPKVESVRPRRRSISPSP